MRTIRLHARSVACALLVALILPLAALAQGSITGTIGGRATDPDGAALPGVTVTATSDGLQGSRVAYTGVNGDFVLPNLPVGTYRVVFALQGMTTIEQIVDVDLGRAARATAALQDTEIEDRIEVLAESPMSRTRPIEAQTNSKIGFTTSLLGSAIAARSSARSPSAGVSATTT